MKKKLPTWAALVIAAAVAGTVALLANGFAAGRIDRKQAAANDAVLEGAERLEALEVRENRAGVQAAYAARDAQGALLGYVGKATVAGYRGPVEVTAGVDLSGVITGVQVGGEDFAETPGLGALTRERAFTDQFVGKTPEITLGVGGVESVSGATISSRAVVGGVNAIANYFRAGEPGLAS